MEKKNDARNVVIFIGMYEYIRIMLEYQLAEKNGQVISFFLLSYSEPQKIFGTFLIFFKKKFLSFTNSTYEKTKSVSITTVPLAQ